MGEEWDLFSEESWNQTNAENELCRMELVEARKQVTTVKNQLRNVCDEFDQSIVLLKRTRAPFCVVSNSAEGRDIESEGGRITSSDQ